MKKILSLGLLALFVLGLAACNNKQTLKENDGEYRRKIYLTEEDYLEDLSKEAEKERRGAKPSIESEYIFELQPETQKNVYFFDERVQPKVPGVPTDREYKNTKRLWEKPKRYTPDQYYGTDSSAAATPANNSSSSSSSYSSYDDDGYDY